MYIKQKSNIMSQLSVLFTTVISVCLTVGSASFDKSFKRIKIKVLPFTASSPIRQGRNHQTHPVVPARL